jgi:putative SOS response-associated peptidase YedK
MHFRRSRRLIPASAYYQWQDPAVGKQPWYFTPADGEPITFSPFSARLGQGQEVQTFCAAQPE